MARPRKDYWDKETGRSFYYKSKKAEKAGKKTFIRIPKGMSQKQFQIVNIKNIVGDTRRIKEKKKKPKITYGGKKVTTSLQPIINNYGLPLYQTSPNFGQPRMTDVTMIPVKETAKAEKIANKVTAEIETQTIPDIPNEIPKETPIDINPNNPNLFPNLFKAIEKQVIKDKKKFTQVTLNPAYVKYRNDKTVKGDESMESFLIYLEKNYKDYKAIIAEHEYNRAKEHYDKLPKIDVKRTDTKEDDVQEGEGDGDGVLEDGLYNDEIERIAKKEIKGHYVPVIPSDHINRLPGLVKKKNKVFGAIINTNPSTSDGSGTDGYKKGHWVSVIVDNRDDYKSIEFFDPLVKNKPSPELLGTLKHIAEKMDPTLMFKLKVNRVRRQAKNSNTCGLHALKFIEDRIKGKPFTEASCYDHWKSTKKSTNDDSEHGEKRIEKAFSQYL